MTAPTHVVGGIAALAFFDLLFPVYRLNFPLILWGAFFSMLPDIDNPKSFIGRILFFASVPFERRFGHRTVTHSFLALILVALCSYFVIYLRTGSYTSPIVWAFTFSMAYFSHLLFDSMTKQGILAYWPSRLWGVIPKKSDWRIRTGSKIELIYFFIFLALSLTFLPIGQSGLISGFNRVFQPGASEVRLQELKHKKATAAHGFTGVQIDSLLRAGAIDPRQANDMKAKLRDAELQEEKFKREQGMFND